MYKPRQYNFRPIFVQITAILWEFTAVVLSNSRDHGRQGKGVPLQAWSGPEGSRKLRFPYYMTTAQDGGKVVNPTHRPPLPTRKCSWYSFLLEAESTPGPQFDRKDYVNEKFQWHHLKSDQRTSDF